MDYSHTTSTNLRFVLSVNNRVSISKENYNRQDYLLSIALLAHDIANLIGIDADYSQKNSNFEKLTVELNETSEITGAKVSLLRGWQYFQSCVKGFNSLGLIATQVIPQLKIYEKKVDIFENISLQL